MAEIKRRFILHPNATRPGVEHNILGHLGTIPKDVVVSVEFKEWKPTRTNQQNKYLWACVYKAFTDALEGWDAEDVHNYLLGEHFGWETLEGMGRKRLRPIRRSSKLNKAEFAEYVDFAIRKGAEHGIIVPLPDTEIPEWTNG